MATISSGADPVAQELHRKQLARALVSSTIGNMIEFYDFGLYGLAASLYLGPLFFPAKDVLTSTLVAFTTFWVGFLARPLGGFIFGHFGDRIGRRATLIATLLTGGTATVLVGLVPTYAQIGIAGGIILTILRVLQGLAVGGEWGGSVLLTIEWANHSRHRGLVTAFPQAGAPVGAALSTLMLTLSTGLLGHTSYWGWRVPFLLSAVLVLLGLYMRLGILETPAFSKLLEERRTERLPAIQVLRRNWGDVVLVALMRTGQQGVIFITNTFILTYGVLVLHLPQSQILPWVIIGNFIELFTGPLFGHLGDRVGRKKLILIGAILMGVFAYPYWAMLNTRIPILVAAAILISLPIEDIQYGPQAAFIPETFTGRLRYSGASLGYQLSAGLFGGLGPIIATSLLQRYHSSTPIAIYMMACALVGVIAVSLMRDRRGQDLSVEYDDVRQAQARPASVVSGD
ncbi:MAG TPA: MFS transporter [Candidatus Dormibacteraeota bacterium]|jgi:MFS family permease|nr:MFS transporter [Candidatus Dormibacteraeota bacterium]